MSCNNWEGGSFTLSVAEYRRFKKAFREGWNRIQEATLQAATRHWERYKSGPLPDTTNFITDHPAQFEEEKDRFYMLWQKWVKKPKPDYIPPNTNWGSWEPRKRPRKPIRKDFPFATSKQTQFNFDEASIRFDDKTREIHYYSGENNRQVERAREQEAAELFFRLLEAVTWTRGTGGQLCGNDEYNQDRSEPGAGGNYTTLQYPKPKTTRGRRW